MILSGPMIKHLAKYYTDGCDVVPGRLPDQIHVQRLDGSDGCLVGGKLDSDPTMAGGIGMSRRTYYKLPTGRKREFPVGDEYGYLQGDIKVDD